MIVRGAVLIPNAKAAYIAALGTSVATADLITRNGFIAVIGAVLTAIVSFYSVRNMRRSYWRDLVAERDAQISELKREQDEKLQERARFAEEQREIRHELKNEVAALRGQLALEEAKHDMSSVFVRLDAVEEILRGRQPMFETMHEILRELKDQTERRTEE